MTSFTKMHNINDVRLVELDCSFWKFVIKCRILKVKGFALNVHSMFGNTCVRVHFLR